MEITDLQNRIKVPYFDYQKLKSVLGDDSHERRAISLLVKKGFVTRVKKGLVIGVRSVLAWTHPRKEKKNFPLL